MEGDLAGGVDGHVLFHNPCDADIVDAGAARSTASVCSHDTGRVPMVLN